MTNFQIENRPWWVQRWLELLDSYRYKKRLERARTYAREGNVLSIEFKGAQVLANVQGSEVEPYLVSLSLTPFSDEDWGYVMETMSKKAIFSAQLLAGEMPAKIEEVFTANGLSVFPYTLNEIRSRCSCPDKVNPCKHIGAVYYELGDRFSEDPFVLFQLRGRTKSQIIEGLRQVRRGEKGKISSQGKVVSAAKSKKISQQTNSLTLNLQKFWNYNEPLESSLVVIAPPSDSKTVLDVLGNLPLAQYDAQVTTQYLKQVYQTATQRAIQLSMNNEQ
ncbi:MAG: SWIM zinc finger family protein [Gomphosphaeria aponina SAG 52.96 = DSM 107014]|uniref:SWIM zinc finger family protein n=1 Tax=Gomphosphaeria aponina SAG 52.96 = DSM 107014 TaxID=1521640 RepID=A0A941JSC6_9CHRO|nr:SWIM zinc finger family protein [Gomphosphaeria aponina SAG 52.96 = DSM 107014]